MKTCNDCKQIKELPEFYRYWRSARNNYQYTSYCKPCYKLRTSKYINSPIGRLKKRENQRLWEANNKEYMSKKRDVMRTRYPEKYKARTMVANYLRLGKICKDPCESCGNIQVDAHHHDYSKPLDVKWLCRQHHLSIHGGYKYV